MNLLEKGAYQAVNTCMKIRPDEKIIIITDEEKREIAEIISKYAEEACEQEVSFFIMEDYGLRPEDGSNPLKFPDEIKKCLEKSDVSFHVATGKKGELKSFRTPMLNTILNSSKLRHAHMIGITKEIMETGMNSDYEKISEVCKKVLDIVSKAEVIKVNTPAGSNFVANFSPSIKWKNCNGILDKPGLWSNLPDGEVFTCVKDINGTIVIDGILGDFFGKKYGLLAKHHVTIELKNGRVVKTSCDNEELKKDLEKYMQQDENANRIGEFAIGTNIGLKSLVGNLLQDEKFPGVHVAIGHGYPEETGSDWNSDAHVDGVLLKPTINVDGKIIMKDGKFLI